MDDSSCPRVNPLTILTAAQHSQIAAAYERAAGDETLPLQARSAFAKKASWFRMLAKSSETPPANSSPSRPLLIKLAFRNVRMLGGRKPMSLLAKLKELADRLL